MIEKNRLSEASFWLVCDVDFINLVKLLEDKRIAKLWCLLVVEVMELLWDDKVGDDI